MPNKPTQSGFTLIELMITVTLAAILMGIGIPSFVETIRSNRLTSITNDLITAFNLARAEAVKRGKVVTVRQVDNNSFTKAGAGALWEDGYDVFVDTDNDGRYDNGSLFLSNFQVYNKAIAYGKKVLAAPLSYHSDQRVVQATAAFIFVITGMEMIFQNLEPPGW